MGNKKQSTPLFFKIAKTESESFNVQPESGESFYPWLHYHPEMQITLVKRGSGTYFIGDSTGQFGPGDVFVIGPGTPHLFRNEPEISENEGVESLSIYFRREAFGDKLLTLPETSAIEALIERSKFGIVVEKESQAEAARQIETIYSAEGFNRLMELLRLLNNLATGYSIKVISRNLLTSMLDNNDDKRLNDVFRFMARNYRRQVSLKEVAGVASMSETAFCRYFVRRTGKTFTGFMNEIRIGYACRMLQSSGMNISEIAYSCGYGNISHFNRQFQKLAGQSPRSYRATLSQ